MKWKDCFIGDFVNAGLADVQTGPFGTQLKASDYVSDGTPVINVRNIGFGNLRAEKLEYVAEQTTERLSAHLLRDSDIVFGRKGAVDRHLFVAKEQENWMQGSDCIRLRFITDEISPRFVSYAFLRSGHQQWMLTQSGNKATMASLNQDIINRIALRLPPRPAQDEIVAVLSAYDELMENNRRRMELLEESARLLYREWLVRLRFPGHEHARLTHGIPEGWERVPFEDALVLQRGFDLPEREWEEGEFPICCSTGIVGHHKEAKVKGPGVFTGRSGSLGVVNYVESDFWPHNTALWVREFKMVTPLFALFLLREMGLEQYNGGASVPTLDRKAVHRVPVLIPPRKFITLFDEQLAPMFSQLRNLREQNQKLRAARDLLLPRLMSGEITV